LLKTLKYFIQFQTLNFANSTHHFFELVRFDFVIDEFLNIYLMEVNMSPNLTPNFGHLEHNAVIYEQLIYNTLKLIGASNYFEMTAG
jgi:hypothetical protein